MSKNVLVKQTGPSVFQQVGAPQGRPSFMDMARTTFAPRDGRVTEGQRAMGALGMLGKVGAAAATAQQTAERMQAGDASAPLQAGITYQGLDPTGTINPNIGEQIKPSETQALPTPSYPAGMQPNTTGQRPGSIGVTPSSNSFSSPIDMSQYPSVANPSGMPQYQGNYPVLMPATQPQATPSTLPQSVQDQVANMNNQFNPNQHINQTQQLHHDAVTQKPPLGPAAQQAMMGTGQQPQSPLGPAAQQAMMGTGQQPPQNNQTQLNDNTRQAQLGEFTRSFVDTLFDKLGPDMVYKMSPHEIGAVSALMYLKLS